MEHVPVAVERAAALDVALLAPRPCSTDEVRVDRIHDGFWCLRIPLPFLRTRAVNCYLLEQDGGFVLVDCGPAAGVGWDSLQRALAMAGVAPDAVHTLLLTHPHVDHAGLTPTVVSATGCRLLRGRGPAAAYDRLRDGGRELDVRRRDARAAGVPTSHLVPLMTSLAHEPAPVLPAADELLDDGATIASAVGPWRVVPIPGHSPSQIALHQPDHGWVIAADLAYGRVRPYIEFGYTPDPITEALEAIERVRALEPQRLFVGHGRDDQRPRGRLDASAEAIHALVEDVRTMRRPDPLRSAYELVCRMLHDNPDPDQRASLLSSVLCVLDHLERRGSAPQNERPSPRLSPT